MRNRPGEVGALLVVLVLTGCGGTRPAGLPAEPTVAGVQVVRPAGLPRIPATEATPERLRAGTYQAPEGFAPALMVTVPDGWWGGGSSSGWSIGRGNDEVNQRYRDAGVFVEVLDLPYRHALSAYRSVEGVLEDGRPHRHSVDGRRATTFMRHAVAEPVVLEDALGVGVDVGPDSWSQTFVDLGRSRTLLVRTEVVEVSAVSAVEGVLASLSLP